MQYFAVVFLCATGGAFAQSSLSGPSLGVIYDASAQAIRPIWGIPGASSAGKRIDTGFAIAAAAISPAQDYALAVSAGGSLKLLIFAPAGLTIKDVHSSATPDRMVLSPSGSAAILYYNNPRGTAAVQVIGGLPNAIQVGPRIDISALPHPSAHRPSHRTAGGGAAPNVLAISDDAAVVLAGVVENTNGEAARGEVFVIPQDGNAPRSIGPAQHVSALAFFRKSHDVVAADDAANSVTMVSDAGGAAARKWMFTDAGLPAPDSVQVSPDNKSIVAGSSRSQKLAMLDAAGANAVFVSCMCAPTEVHPLIDAAIYQVTEVTSGLLWILDSNPLNPRVLFVPVPNESDPQ
jgi:hypothetical protein